MINEKVEEKIFKKACFFLKFRPRTEKEIKGYLIKKTKVPLKIIEDVIKKLKEEDLINDEKFIEWFVDQRKIFRPKSVWVLKKELSKLGISKDLINNFFEKKHLNEEELAIKALQKRWESFKKLPQKIKYKKTISFLIRRGFSFDISQKVFKKMEERKEI